MADTIIVYMHSGSPSLIKCWLPLLRFRSLSSPTFFSIGCLTSLWSLCFFFFWAKWSLRFWWRSGPWNWWYFLQTRPHVRSIIHQSEHEWAVVLQRSDYDSNPSFWNQSPEGSRVSSDLDCSSSSAAPTGLTRTRYLQNRSVYHTLVRTCL